MLFYIRWRLKLPRGLRRPYMIVIPEGKPRMHIVPLHEALLPLKPSAKVSDETRRRAAETIEAEVRRVLTAS